MIHPDTELRKINETIGCGVFAVKLIPAGTIVYVKDPLEIEISPARYRRLNALYRGQLDWFSYIDARGVRILSWDIAKFVNHSCEPNSISTGFGFEIAIKDILPGEEITDEYGLFNLSKEMNCCCSAPGCRGKVTPCDWSDLAVRWDALAMAGLRKSHKVSQPLLQYMSPRERTDLFRFQAGRIPAPSVRSLLCRNQTESAIPVPSKAAFRVAESLSVLPAEPVSVH